MSDLLTDDILDNNPQQEKQRPVFLLVLCILSFIGAGLGLLGALMNVFTMGQAEEAFTQMNNLVGDSSSSFGVNFEDSYKWTKISNYLNLVGNALCLAGALFMFKLRKLGFYIYVPGQILPIVGSFLAVNSLLGGGMFAGLGMIAIVFGSLFSLAFIIMYGLNLKHMN
jgi:hypothetical protein